MSNIQRVHIEQLILSSFINQLRTNEIDQIEFQDMRIPFKLFKANKTHQLVAKAIFNLQEESKMIDDVNILAYIERFTTVNENEFLDASCCLWTTFDTMMGYLKMLEEIDREEEKHKILMGL